MHSDSIHMHYTVERLISLCNLGGVHNVPTFTQFFQLRTRTLAPWTRVMSSFVNIGPHPVDLCTRGYCEILTVTTAVHDWAFNILFIVASVCLMGSVCAISFQNTQRPHTIIWMDKHAGWPTVRSLILFVSRVYNARLMDFVGYIRDCDPSGRTNQSVRRLPAKCPKEMLMCTFICPSHPLYGNSQVDWHWLWWIGC